MRSVSQGGLLWACTTYTIHTQQPLCMSVLYESALQKWMGSGTLLSLRVHPVCVPRAAAACSMQAIKGGKERRLRLFTIWTLHVLYALESPIVACVYSDG